MSKSLNTSDTDTKSLSHCRCGHDRKHSKIKAQCKYSFWGWITFMIGITTPPIKVEFRCEECGDVLETLSDKETLRHYQGW